MPTSKQLRKLLKPYLPKSEAEYLSQVLKEDLLEDLGSDPLSEAEKMLIEDGLVGREIKIDANGNDSKIRGPLLVWILTEPAFRSRLGRRRLHVEKAVVTAASEGNERPSLELDGAELSTHVTFEKCTFPNGLMLRGTVCRDFELLACKVGCYRPSTGFYSYRDKEEPVGIDAPNLHVRGDLSIVDVKPLSGPHEGDPGRSGLVDLRKSRVEGTVDLRDTHLRGKNVALDAGGLVAGRVLLSEEFRADGTVYFYGCDIAHEFDAKGAYVDASQNESAAGTRPTEVRTLALSLRHANIGGRLRLADGFCALGVTDLMHARVGGPLVLRGGRFLNPGGVALVANDLRVDDDVLLYHRSRLLEPAYNDDHRATPTWTQIPLRPAKPLWSETEIEDVLDVELLRTEGPAGTKVLTRVLWLHSSKTVSSATREGRDRARFYRAVEEGLSHVERCVPTSEEERESDAGTGAPHEWLWGPQYRWRCIVLGEASFVGIRVDGQFDASAAIFIAPPTEQGSVAPSPSAKGTDRGEHGKRIALSLHRSRLNGRVKLGSGFRAEGIVALESAEIEGSLILRGGWFLNPSGIALLAPRLQVKGDVQFSLETLVDDRRSLVVQRRTTSATQRKKFDPELEKTTAETVCKTYFKLHGGRDPGKRPVEALREYFRLAQSAQNGTNKADVHDVAGFFAHRSVCYGKVMLKRGRVGGSVDFSGGLFVRTNGEEHPSNTDETKSSGDDRLLTALDVQQMQVEKAIFLGDWRPPTTQREHSRCYPLVVDGVVDLSGSRVQQFHLTPERGITANGNAETERSWRIEGFEYESIFPSAQAHSMPLDRERSFDLLTECNWFDHTHPGATNQPFEHLAATLRNQGHHGESRSVLLRAVLPKMPPWTKFKWPKLKWPKLSKTLNPFFPALHAVYSLLLLIVIGTLGLWWVTSGSKDWLCFSGQKDGLCFSGPAEWIVSAESVSLEPASVTALPDSGSVPSSAPGSGPDRAPQAVSPEQRGSPQPKVGASPTQAGPTGPRDAPSQARKDYPPLWASIEAVFPFVNLGISSSWRPNYWPVYLLMGFLQFWGVVLLATFALGIAEVIRKPT